MIVYKCDVCGAEYDDYKDIKQIKRSIRGGLHSFDVCERCLADFDKIFMPIKEMLEKHSKSR